MPKIKVQTGARKFHLCPNCQIRRKVWNYRDGICFHCGRKMRLKKSAAFFSDRCNTHLSQKTGKWVYDLNDYAWICRECLSKDSSDPRLKLTQDDWQKAQSYSYKNYDNGKEQG